MNPALRKSQVASLSTCPPTNKSNNENHNAVSFHPHRTPFPCRRDKQAGSRKQPPWRLRRAHCHNSAAQENEDFASGMAEGGDVSRRYRAANGRRACPHWRSPFLPAVGRRSVRRQPGNGCIPGEPLPASGASLDQRPLGRGRPDRHCQLCRDPAPGTFSDSGRGIPGKAVWLASSHEQYTRVDAIRPAHRQPA